MQDIKFINIVLPILWIGMAAVAVELSYILTITDSNNIGSLISAIAILISSAVASASIMKSISETKGHDITKSEKEKERKRIFALNVMKTVQVTLGTFSKKAESDYRSKIGLGNFRTPTDFDSDIQTTGKLLNSVFCESILPYLPDEEQEIISNFYSEYYRFLATYEDDTIKRSHIVPGQFLTKKTSMQLHKYVKIFTAFAQSYIDLYTQKKGF